MDETISREMAEQEFDRFIEAMDLDAEHYQSLGDEDRKQFDECKRIFVREVTRGSLVLGDDDMPIYTPRRSRDKTPLVFHEPTGVDLREADKAKSGSEILGMHRVLGAITKTNSARIGNLASQDLNVVVTIFLLFLA